jgi:hypothetical protein
MGEAPEFKNIEQTYALIEKEEFQQPELNPLFYRLGVGGNITLSPTPLLNVILGTSGKKNDIVLLNDKEISKTPSKNKKDDYIRFTSKSTSYSDILKAISYAQRQKQEEFLSQKDGSFPPIGFTDPINGEPLETVFVFDWLSDVCDNRPDLFIGGLFQKPNQFQLGVFSLLNVRLVSSEDELNGLKDLLDFENAKYVMNIEKKKVFGKYLLVNVQNTIKAQSITTGEKVEIKQVGTKEKADPHKEEEGLFKFLA